MEKQKTKKVNLKKIMVQIPENSIEVYIQAKFYEKGKLIEVYNTMDIDMIRERFQDAEENYLDPSEVFVLTEDGLQLLDEQEQKK